MLHSGNVALQSVMSEADVEAKNPFVDVVTESELQSFSPQTSALS